MEKRSDADADARERAFHGDETGRGTIFRGRTRVVEICGVGAVRGVCVALGKDDADSFCWHLLMIGALRFYANAQLWISLLEGARRRGKRGYSSQAGIDFKQVDREDHWDDYILLQTLVISAVHWMPKLGFDSFRRGTGEAWRSSRLHAGPTSLCITGSIARCIITNCTARTATRITTRVSSPSHYTQRASIHGASGCSYRQLCHSLCRHVHDGRRWPIAMFYIYLIGFDVLNAIGHCNFEFIPRWFMRLPGMKYSLI